MTEASLSDDYETPDDVFNICNAVWGIQADACASEQNTKKKMYLSIEDDALSSIPWQTAFHHKYGVLPKVIWCNPPYGKATKIWVVRAIQESKTKTIVWGPPPTVILLLPALTDQAWMGDLNKHSKRAFYFWRKRMQFKPAKSSARFPNVIVSLNAEIKDLSAYMDLTSHCTIIDEA